MRKVVFVEVFQLLRIQLLQLQAVLFEHVVQAHHDGPMLGVYGSVAAMLHVVDDVCSLGLVDAHKGLSRGLQAILQLQHVAVIFAQVLADVAFQLGGRRGSLIAPLPEGA